jgi:hypothetical protein
MKENIKLKNELEEFKKKFQHIPFNSISISQAQNFIA